MKKLYFAAPTRFESVDFNKIGTGQNVARNGHGIYMGERHLAMHYLDTYRHFSDADATYISKNDNIIDADSVVGRKILELEADKVSYPTQESIVREVQEEFNISLNDHYRGCLYEVSLKEINSCDEGQEVSEEECFELIGMYLDDKPNSDFIDKLNKIDRFFDYDDEIDIEVFFNSTLPSEAIEELANDLYNALEEAADQDFIEIDDPSTFDVDSVRSYLYKVIAHDSYSLNDRDSEIENLLPEDLTHKIRDMSEDSLILEVKDATIKDTYGFLCGAYDKPDLGINMAGEAITKVTGYNTYQCENNMAQQKSFELVVFNKQAAESLKIKEIPRSDISYDHELDYKSGRGLEM